MLCTENLISPPPPIGELFQPVVAFGRDAPFELEIGCGKGGFLLRRALDHPEINILGIEWANKYFKFAADRMARWGVGNVRVMRTDARHFVLNHLAADCLSALHVYHPDPWPKKRHHKRRLFQPDFVVAATGTLVVGGRWTIQTDHAEYFQWIQRLVARMENLESVAYDDPSCGIADASAGTNFEIKYRRQGRAIFALTCRRV